MTVGTLENKMDKDSAQKNKTQADFIKEELNFNINSDDPMTKASLSDYPLHEWIDILGNGQLKKKVCQRGINGTRPQRGDICTIKFVSKLDGDLVAEYHENIVIQLGDMEVIQGLDLGIALMDLHETAEMIIDPRFAYGKLGQEPRIPSNATLYCTVELISFEPEPDMETLSFTRRRELSNKKRARGNWWFLRDEPSLAIHCYRRALDYLSSQCGGAVSNLDAIEEIGDSDLQDILEDRIKVYNNLAASQIKTLAFDAALESVENVLCFQPKNIKALYRKGKILHFKGEHKQAYETLLQAAKLEPESKLIQTELAVLKEKNAKDALHEKYLYRKMFGTNKNTNTKKIKIEEKWKTNKILWGLVGGASAAALVGLLAYKFAS